MQGYSRLNGVIIGKEIIKIEVEAIDSGPMIEKKEGEK